MTYSLNTLSGARGDTPPGAPRGVWSRLGDEALLLIGGALIALWALSLVSHSAADAAWSTSGSMATGSVHN
ncbi:MAG: hypothetical protein EBU07_06690, partial [Betaproteobacteria bacterium]|nr:hypothetical protein [Betaproteobacteria bacterium]